MSNTFTQIHTLSAAGVGVVLGFSEDRLPVVIHWGADPGVVPLAGYQKSALSVLPMQHEGWAGRPAASGDRAGRWPHLRLRLTEPVQASATGLRVRAADDQAAVAVETQLEISPQGIVQLRHTLTNLGADNWQLAALRCLLPVPDEAGELLDLTGRWSLERQPQRAAFGFGAHVRESRRGRTGHDSTTLLCSGTPNFAHRSGELWSVHIGWSGNHEHTLERLPDSVAALGGGELLDPGEIVLAPGESYTTPTAYFAYSSTGLDGVRERFHAYLRARPGHPATPRPVVLNTWEAVYFDHDLDKLKTLADLAAQIGVERFVLDDGWFRHRRHDRAGLGDWHVDGQVWPEGLYPLVGHVRELGLEFGLWFEPEMVNPDSDLARAHPDWVLAAPGRLPAEHRHQHVLDLANPDAYAYLLERISSLVSEYRIDYLKWDHNRDLVEAVHQDGRAGVHRQTLAAYALLDELRARHPGLEIESCSSGGARVDLGILERTDRVWTSDTNDPIDRQRIQQWTSLLVPLELLGAHVGAGRAHVTGRRTGLALRCATALFGHAGLEWDLTECPPEELDEIAEWIDLYKRTRGLLHSGRMVTPDRYDLTSHVYGVVAQDGLRALVSYAQLDSAVGNLSGFPVRVRFPGLGAEVGYRIEVALKPETALPPETLPLVMTGSALAAVGIPLPRLKPGDALVLELTAI